MDAILEGQWRLQLWCSGLSCILSPQREQFEATSAADTASKRAPGL